MFNKNKFAQILKNINDTYPSMTEFAKKADFDRTYISKYINMKLDNPPTPKILQKISSASNGMVSYQELMTICGYISNPNLNDNVNYVFQQMIAEKINSQYSSLNIAFDNLIDLTTDRIIISQIMSDFCNYCDDVVNNAYNESYDKKIFDYTNVKIPVVFSGFKILYSGLLKRLYSLRKPIKHNDIFLINKHLILHDDKKDIDEAISIIISSKKYIYSLYEKWKITTQYYMIPVYGQISAGQPNWAEECIEGKLPIDPVLFNIVNPKEHFFLRVNGESMNKLIRNGAYALIHKQDIVEDGEIAVVLVNGYEATLKKFSKQGDFIVLEPMSDDESFKTQIYDKNTPIKILGKYVGKFEMK